MKNRTTRESVFALSFLLIIITVSCSKYITPNKTERIIQKDRWSITSYILDDVSVPSQQLSIPMMFDENGLVFANGGGTLLGHWSTGLNKNPTVLYLKSFPVLLSFLNNDWEIISISKKKIELESGGSLITLVRV